MVNHGDRARFVKDKADICAGTGRRLFSLYTGDRGLAMGEGEGRRGREERKSPRRQDDGNGILDGRVVWGIIR